ncbi:PREDICTED: growth arrest-specific protein 7 isoform X7 [Hipposideros armiger]|uniref:Growth arrest-specific protein 7 isoform X7 n=1 Tax=Hipposideros armiger TaxID=186990 RepID=A0A8B7SDR0_HIPAR|nr:PREDICTED: growth arrest-specific protein 7 isoform X7 [Hipposideros armiger]
METVIGRRIRPELSSSLGGSWDVRWCRSLEWSPLRQEKKARLSFSHLAGKATCLPRGGVTMSTRPPMRPPGSVPAVLLGFQPARAFTGALCLQQNLGSSSPGKKHSKENTITINCVTFPHPDTMPEQQLLKPTEWSYCDYFWADKKDPQGNGTVAGFELLLQKQLKGKQMQKEMSEFIRERIKIEEDYAKNLAKLSQNSLAAQEEGSLGEAWAQVKKSLADEAEVHLKFSSKLHSEVEKPLMNFRENFKKDMKKCDHHIADLRKQLASRYVAVEKARKALTERQRDLEMKTQQLEIKLSNKTEEDIKKARRKSTQAGDDLMRCVDLYNQAQSKWFEEMVTTTLELERLEVERVEMIRQHLCQYTQLRHETDMFNQSTVEPVDQLLRKVDPAKDRELWVREHKTGNIRPVDMEI